MINLRLHFVGNFIHRLIRFIAQRINININSTNEQSLNNNIRIEKSNKNKLFFDLRNKNVQNNNNQIIDNLNVFHENNINDGLKI